MEYLLGETLVCSEPWLLISSLHPNQEAMAFLTNFRLFLAPLASSSPSPPPPPLSSSPSPASLSPSLLHTSVSSASSTASSPLSSATFPRLPPAVLLPESSSSSSPPRAPVFPELPLGAILSVDISHLVVTLTTKDARKVILRFSADSPTMDSFVRSLKLMAFPAQIQRIFAFQHFPAAPAPPPGAPPPYEFSLEQEYARLGLASSKEWVVSQVNQMFKVSASYPELLVVPRCLTDAAIRKVGKFRSSGRLPVVTWKRPGEPQVLMRSSQPCVGLVSTRCHEDEVLLREVKSMNPGQPKFLIFDARNYAAAFANRAAGGGFENTADVSYHDCEVVFLNIGNIHIVRESFEAVVKACQTSADDDRWFSILEATKWHFHLSSLLSGAVQVVKALHVDKLSCLMHCTDGWDRTSQLVSLAQLMLDPHYRTMKGFFSLIEKDWLHFGHPFGQRTGQPGFDAGGSFGANSNATQMAPIFFQFLNCVFQLLRQRPDDFEFNEALLLLLAEHTTSCRFGTFLCNTQQERQKLQVSQRTLSLWSHVLGNRWLYENPTFDPQRTEVILPACNARSIVLWSEVFFPYETRRRSHSTDPGVELAARNLANRVEAMRKRNLDRRKLRLQNAVLKAFNENRYRKKLLRAEALLVSASLVESILNLALRSISSSAELWTSISAQDHDDGPYGHHDDDDGDYSELREFENDFVLV